MFKKLFLMALCVIFALGLLVSLPKIANAQNASYTFRSTIMGAGINQTGQYSYEISGAKSDFNVNESPYFLTRIFNISNVDKFQFKHEIRSASYSREIFSPVYNPNGQWWSEIYYWDELGKIPAGNYELTTYVSINGGYYKYERKTNFSVSNDNYYTPVVDQNTYRPYEDYQYYYAQSRNYTYNWTNVGKNIQKTGQYSYAIVNKTMNFNSNEDVYALAMVSNISGIDTFQIKFDIYANGNRYIRTNEVPTLWPRGQKWADNYSWANLGKLSNGYYEIRTHISINGGSYVKLNTQTINVGNSCENRNYNCSRDCSNSDKWNRRNNDCGRSCDYKPAYTYDWTRLNDSVKKTGTYRYDMSDRSNVFYSDESIKALTRISNINNIGFFQVKHDLYQNGTFKREYLGSSQKPDRNYWEYNYTQSDLGQLSEGDYMLKTYISVDGSSFQLVGTKNFSVKIKRISTQNSYHRNYNNDCGYRDWSQSDNYYYAERTRRYDCAR
ncbi:MAG: hypothetical protein US83_C0004G0012 [Candidatus Falkowbacteria bacterium GW2011_GWC2_38_22]|uniref:Uncharacterized protein n=1 Tax=Candidatus Falkowbacteria bacterium GW2011_GWE1_38_31 TaxID=1618638 RepID=A0A0G0K5C0_9BACT|nr:MAG: hypothetical protein US73_C0002G0105 [Candidatus Falkowbacteria bacterium GW2011_GWF2_38_1205]KKQ61628.1 MAG: hypothetical protein US83_C0004G0012 [Candidatus Falkowbacteria bacterium GW2011_GWC2_38_22]KKQ63757.1 MAG: hypothetical protein US84_C0004G0105 [Candidatus Falkowbacteria bacterium GW2011_GWF1_38_22]KKQ65827.1 MAG: hypothetical protein US87_C0004G0012 [Candidatus Falkowbacteria bacterium GW2011_GWE2_38_254]KKQ70620.1 MAG: hypothetical protein US91_C0004G0105 [Candidatus Falkowb